MSKDTATGLCLALMFIGITGCILGMFGVVHDGWTLLSFIPLGIGGAGLDSMGKYPGN